MWKWVIALCLGMYATLMLFGGEGFNPDTVVQAPEPVAVEEPVVTVEVEPTPEPAPAPEAVVAVEPEPDLPAPSQTAAVDVTATEIEAIAPVTEPAPAADPITITAAPQATILRETTLVDAPKPELPIWRVTGSRVNLRAEANGQAQIVGRTVRGDSAEIIELLQNGWAKVYIIDSGIEAYMSADFIAPEG